MQDRKQQVEDEVWKEMEDYIFTWEPEMRITQQFGKWCRNQKIWSTEIVAKVQELGQKGGKRLSRCRIEKEEEESL